MKLAEIFFSEDDGSADAIKAEIEDLLFLMKEQGITEIDDKPIEEYIDSLIQTI